MSIFNLFRKKDSFHVTDLVWIDSAAKQEGIIQFIINNPDTVVFCWFNQTQEDWQEILGHDKRIVLLSRQLNASQIGSKTLLGLEHYPLYNKEKEFLKPFHKVRIFIASSLDEPLFVHFGGNRLADVMTKMGMLPNEAVNHKMVSAAIGNAQKKLDDKVMVEYSAQSMQDWFQKNIGIKKF